MMRLLATIAVWCAASIAASAQPRPFDGSWDVTVTCAESEGGGRGYALRFPAQAQNGVLQGEQQGGRGSAATTYRIEGPIRPDGTARLKASGVVVNPATANRNAGPNTPYR